VQTAPAWRKATIQPALIEELTSAAATVGTLYGSLSVSWRRLDRDIELSVTVPVGVEATVKIPRSGPKNRLFEGNTPLRAFSQGKTVSGSQTARRPRATLGIISVSDTPDFFEVVVTSGRYDFRRKGN
jgi:alpha-L-rhamnosidase